MSEFDDLLKMLVDFREERDWAQFHDSKNLTLALSIEAAELNELFLWKTESQAEDVNAKTGCKTMQFASSGPNTICKSAGLD